MSNSKHTPGPWRWEVSRKSKNVRLCGGVPRFDLTVVDFQRWGTHSATLRLREDEAGFNIMERPHERDGWVVPFEGREHHAEWCATLDHPDARLIAAAPDLLAACEAVERWWNEHAIEGTPETDAFCTLARAAIAAAKGGAR